MLIVIGEAEAQTGQRDRFLAAVSTMSEATSSDDGCELYGFYTDVTRPEVVLSVEIWRDQAALDAHMSHPHTRDFVATVPGLVAGTPSMHFFTAERAQERAR